MERLKTMLNYINSSICFFFLSAALYAQSPISDFKFAESLYVKKKYALALEEVQILSQQNPSVRLNLLTNKCYFKLKDFKSISKPEFSFDSIFFPKSYLLYFGVHCFTDTIPPDYILSNGLFTGYKELYTRIFYLKERKNDLYQFERAKNLITNPELIQYNDKLDNLYNDYRRSANKKPCKAALLSLIMPGLGKVYAGRPTEIIGALFRSVIFGLISFEGYKKNNFHSVQFYAFGALYFYNYSSAVYGSYIAVKSVKKDNEIKYYDELSKCYEDITNHLID
jgi:hypothetical protein